MAANPPNPPPTPNPHPFTYPGINTRLGELARIAIDFSWLDPARYLNPSDDDDDENAEIIRWDLSPLPRVEDQFDAPICLAKALFVILQTVLRVQYHDHPARYNNQEAPLLSRLQLEHALMHYIDQGHLVVFDLMLNYVRDVGLTSEDAYDGSPFALPIDVPTFRFNHDFIEPVHSPEDEFLHFMTQDGPFLGEFWYIGRLPRYRYETVPEHFLQWAAMIGEHIIGHAVAIIGLARGYVAVDPDVHRFLPYQNSHGSHFGLWGRSSVQASQLNQMVRFELVGDEVDEDLLDEDVDPQAVAAEASDTDTEMSGSLYEPDEEDYSSED